MWRQLQLNQHSEVLGGQSAYIRTLEFVLSQTEQQWEPYVGREGIRPREAPFLGYP